MTLPQIVSTERRVVEIRLAAEFPDGWCSGGPSATVTILKQQEGERP
jgi:hypothetical protein